MESKDIVIRLIAQDMKHTQLTAGLQRIGLEPELHHLSIVNIVLQLMGANEGEHWPDVSDDIGSIYFRHLDAATEFPVTHTGQELLPVAERCFEELTSYLCTLKE